MSILLVIKNCCLTLQIMNQLLRMTIVCHILWTRIFKNEIQIWFCFPYFFWCVLRNSWMDKITATYKWAHNMFQPNMSTKEKISNSLQTSNNWLRSLFLTDTYLSARWNNHNKKSMKKSQEGHLLSLQKSLKTL